MARLARIEYEGAFYHVMNRGNRKEVAPHKDCGAFSLLVTKENVCWEGKRVL